MCLTQKYRVQFLQNLFFLINQDILISLSDSSARIAGLSFFPLPKTERCLEPLLKFRLLHSFGAYRQVVTFNEDQSVHASTGSVVHVQTRFQQRLSISLLDEPRRQGTMPSKRGIVIMNWPERIKTQPHDDRDNCFQHFDSKGSCGMTVNNDIDDDSATKHSDSHTRNSHRQSV